MMKTKVWIGTLYLPSEKTMMVYYYYYYYYKYMIYTDEIELNWIEKLKSFNNTKTFEEEVKPFVFLVSSFLLLLLFFFSPFLPPSLSSALSLFLVIIIIIDYYITVSNQIINLCKNEIAKLVLLDSLFFHLALAWWLIY